MSSDYAQRPLGGKAASLAANEHVATPSPPSKPARAQPPSVSKALPTYHATSTKPFFPGQKPDHVVSAGKAGMISIYKYGSGKPGPDGNLQTLLGAPAKGQSPARSQAALAQVYRQNHPVGQEIIQGVANSVPGVSLAKAIRDNHVGAGAVASEVFNDVTSGLVPAGKAAGIIGGLRGLKKISEASKAVDVGEAAAKVAKLPKVQQKAIQVVREGVPIEKRIQDASAHLAAADPADTKQVAAAKKEIGLLRAARRHVVDVNGMPRIDPHNPKLIDIYEKALAQEPQDALRETLKGARNVRGKQEAGYSAERTTRFANANKFLNDQTLAPEQRLALAKNELKGELPKIDFQGMKVLDENSVKALQAHILNHPHLLPGQKIRAADALTNALGGRVPTNSELTLLEHVFGKETANGIHQVATHPLRQALLSAINVPRSLMASFDLSAPFRQGLVVATRHPVIFGRNFKPMVKAFGSDNVYHGILDEIRSRPTYPMMLEGKVSFTELGKQAGKREEQFQSDLAEKIPIAGRGVKASGRAYTAFLDKTRADVFDHLLQRAQEQGRNVQDEKFLKDLGRYVNSATGRGPLGAHFQGAATALNAFFFSPRLLASRIDLIFSPITYAHADPFVRREALRSMIQLAGTASTLLALASQIPGVKVVLDPRNPDWGKIRLGNTRIDIGGGFQQPLRLFAQLATGVAISSTTGKKLNLTANGFGQPTRLDLLLRFFEGKESPIASFVTDYLRNSNQVGTKFSWSKEAYQRVIPLLAQDSYDLYNAHHGGVNGLAAAFAGYGIGSVGFGLQTYGPKVPKVRVPASYDPYGSNGSLSGSDYAQTGGSSGSDYAQAP